MPDDNETNLNRQLATKIVAAYVGGNQVAPDQLGSLIAAVHAALGHLSKPTAEPASERTPAVSVRRSVSPDHVICMDCGWRGKMLRRHLMTRHGLNIDQYRARWSLPRDHAMVAPAYSERRSTLAKQIGLGQRGRRSITPAAEKPTAAPRRRRRPRSAAIPT
jgi:predicted transcriptional regulator